MLAGLSLEALLDHEFVGCHRAERVQIAEVPYIWYLDRSIVKTYDYINRVVIMLPFFVYEGTWTHSLLSLLCITMILRVRRIFFEITAFPNSGIRARSMRRCYMHE